MSLAPKAHPQLEVVENDGMIDSLVALREARLEASPSPDFDLPIIRRWRHERSVRSPRYWMPFLIAGLVSASLAWALGGAATAPVETPDLTFTEQGAQK